MNTKKRYKVAARKELEALTGGTLTISRLINSIRLCEEVSLTRFSSMLDISPSHLCDIENGRKVVSPERAAKFARVLGRSEEQFIRIALQDILAKSGLKYQVEVKAA